MLIYIIAFSKVELLWGIFPLTYSMGIPREAIYNKKDNSVIGSCGQKGPLKVYSDSFVIAAS